MERERPLRDLLDVRTSEREIHEVWRGVKERREARRARRPVVLALACAAAAAFVVLFLRRPVGVRVPVGEAGPLAVVAGAVERPLAGGDAIQAPTDLSDGSRVALAAGARLSIVENTGRTFVTHLERGRADFSVKPGGPRRWVVECGRSTVEVVGTEFTVDRSDGGLRVDVRHGVVVVRGEDLPDRIRRLVAGDALRLTASETTMPSAAPAEAPPAAVVSAVPSAEAPPDVAAPPHVVAVEGAPASAAPPLDAVASLYDDADRARRGGKPDDAVRLIESAVSKEPRGHRAAIACFTLGRLYLDELGKPGSAARAFERSLAAGPPLGLEEDVRARLVEAHAKMGDPAGARRAADQYRVRFPGGRRAADVDRWSPSE